MDDVQFEGENNYITGQFSGMQKVGFLTKFAMKLGAKNYAQAEVFLLVIALVSVALTIIVIRMQFVDPNSDVPPAPPIDMTPGAVRY